MPNFGINIHRRLTGRRFWLISFSAIFVIVMAVIIYWKVWIPEYHPECPHSVTDAITGVTQVSIAGPITDVPEFHDCQRLRVGASYGPVVAIWVSVRIDSLLSDMFRTDPIGPTSTGEVGRG